VGKAKKIGIGIGAGMAGVFVVFVIGFLGFLESEYDDARLAQLESRYFYDSDRLIVAVLLTDKDAEYTKASGNLDLYIKKDDILVYTANYDFVKDDFLSWKDNSGYKKTGYRIQIDKFFPSGSHDVYVNLETKSGSYWKDLHTSFYSLE